MATISRKIIKTKNNQKISTILIAGAGQIGSRYLQGMFNCKIPLDIYVHDISEQSLHNAKKRWEQMIRSGYKTQHKVSFISILEKVPQQIDFAVVSTNADVRAQVVEQIVKKSDVHYWILEKFLAQSERELEDISSLTQDSDGAWVNIPRRMMVRQKQIRSYLPKKVPLLVKGRGNRWGLACNGIHQLDLVAWWTGETLKSIENSGPDSQWYESKRKGFFDILGKITAHYSGGTVLILESNLDGQTFTLEVEAESKIWKICDDDELISGPDGFLISSKNEKQSSITTGLVEAVLESGQCDLTELSESVKMHRVFLRYLLEDWNHVHGTNVDTLHIT